MAGIDGIKNKIDPGKAFDKDLYTLGEDEVKKLPTVCGSLREAMESLDKDRKFLTQGGVFTDDQIDAYIDLKFQEIYNLNILLIRLSLRCITVSNTYILKDSPQPQLSVSLGFLKTNCEENLSFL